MKGWLPDPPDLGPFRFGKRDAARRLGHLSDHELRERTLARLPALVAAWRMGPDRTRTGGLIRRMAGAGVPRERLEGYPATLETREALAGLLTRAERRGLGVGS